MPEYSPGSTSRTVAGRGVACRSTAGASVSTVGRAGLQVDAGEADRPEAAVRRLGDGGDRRKGARLLRQPHDRRPGFREGHAELLDFALHRNQQDPVDARIRGKAVELQPEEGAFVPAGQERVALPGDGRIHPEPVLREQGGGRRFVHGRPVLVTDGLGRVSRQLGSAVPDRQKRQQEGEKSAFHLSFICLQR